MKRLWLISVCWMLLGSPEVANAFPNFDEFLSRYRSSEAILLDRSGQVLHEIRWDNQRRRLSWTQVDSVSRSFLESIVYAEDRRFFEHEGIDFWALGGAVRDLVWKKKLRGASTITMQTASLIKGWSASGFARRTFFQKIRQFYLAWQLDSEWTKDEILEAYVNLVSFRGELQGIAAASRALFQKEPHALNREEAVVLATLVRSPNTTRDRLERRSCFQYKMEHKEWECNSVQQVIAQIFAGPYHIKNSHDLAPHVARRLISGNDATSNQWDPLHTTIDRDLQEFSLQTLRAHLLRLRGKNMRDGAVIVLHNATGDVLAYVGNSEELSSARYVDAIQARRQAGSTLKPFLYGVAFEKKILTPASLLRDVPLNLNVGHGIYHPSNYDNKYRGAVSARVALASSLNVPAVRTLELVGQETFARRLRDLGFTGMRSGSYYGPAMALGSVDISLWELANAYRALSNNGMYSEPGFLMERKTKPLRKRVFTFGSSFLLSSILSDRASRQVTFGLENILATPFWTAVKTGTSQDMRDNWCVGYSDRYTVGVWTGNFSGEPSWNVSGVDGAAPIWAEIMGWLHRHERSIGTEPPPSVIARRLHRLQGASDWEWFLKGTEPVSYQGRVKHNWRRIVYPQSGMIIAKDPDIPSDAQRVLFNSEPKDESMYWDLDGRAVGHAGQMQMWEPRRGKHTLTLRDHKNNVIDRVKFEVR